MTWLITGANGQLGKAFRRALKGDGTVRFANRSSCDLCDPDSLKAYLAHETPSVIFNCAAYTAVDAAEHDEETANSVNANAVGEMARWAKEHDALMVHFSSDYVFDGAATSAYDERAPINPLSVYGSSKAAGEMLFLESGVRGFCLRTSWVHSNDGYNFLLTMKRLMRERDYLQIVDDQFGVPTTTDFLAYVTVNLIKHYQKDKVEGPRLFHAVPDGQTSWFGFANHIKKMLAQQNGLTRLAEIEPIPSSEFPQVAKRHLIPSCRTRVCDHILANRSADGKTGMTNSDLVGEL